MCSAREMQKKIKKKNLLVGESSRLDHLEGVAQKLKNVELSVF